jgi:hypothetical protein
MIAFMYKTVRIVSTTFDTGPRLTDSHYYSFDVVT